MLVFLFRATFFRGFAPHENRQMKGIVFVKMQSGWVIVYIPGGDIYQMLDPVGPPRKKQTLTRRVLKGSVKTLLTCVQLYWWIKS